MISLKVRVYLLLIITDSTHAGLDYAIGIPSGVVTAEDNDIEMDLAGKLSEQSFERVEYININIKDIPAAVIPIQATGMIDISGSGVTDSDIVSHAFANATEEDQTPSFLIRRSSAFINEYARKDEVMGLRSDGGPSNPNHLLGSFPVLFPYGAGGFEVWRKETVPYEVHSRWALQYHDKRFRHDLQFVFQVFGVMQKRMVCRSAALQMQRSAYRNNEVAIRMLKPADLLKASAEEARRVPFSNPSVQALRSQITAVRANVQGTDESRKSIRTKIWSATVMLNPPNLWITINPSDTQDPIAQVMAGIEIDLDKFNSMVGPSSKERNSTISKDPYASAHFFHLVIQVVLEELFGLTAAKGAKKIQRKPGIVGELKAYIGSVEAQGRGSLHLHIIMWLVGGPTAEQMKELLTSQSFRDRVCAFIRTCISADIDELDELEIKALPKEKGVAFSRPLDPAEEHYTEKCKARDKVVARAVQFHSCTQDTCLKMVKNRQICKRRAPFPLSSMEWIEPSGAWGPKRYCGKLNNWNKWILRALRANHDIKLITNAPVTKNITWYLSTYTSKKQSRSKNTSAVLANRLAFHNLQEKKDHDSINRNKRLLTRCVNSISRDQEFSAPEVISYIMGWGDRYISHHFVPIYWDSAAAALKKTFPGLKRKTLSFMSSVRYMFC